MNLSRTMTDQRTDISIKQVSSIASMARDKLGEAADMPDLNLRLLIGHANLLDGMRSHGLLRKRG